MRWPRWVSVSVLPEETRCCCCGTSAMPPAAPLIPHTHEPTGWQNCGFEGGNRLHSCRLQRVSGWLSRCCWAAFQVLRCDKVAPYSPWQGCRLKRLHGRLQWGTGTEHSSQPDLSTSAFLLEAFLGLLIKAEERMSFKRANHIEILLTTSYSSTTPLFEDNTVGTFNLNIWTMACCYQKTITSSNSFVNSEQFF